MFGVLSDHSEIRHSYTCHTVVLKAQRLWRSSSGGWRPLFRVVPKTAITAMKKQARKPATFRKSKNSNDKVSKDPSAVAAEQSLSTLHPVL